MSKTCQDGEKKNLGLFIEFKPHAFVFRNRMLYLGCTARPETATFQCDKRSSLWIMDWFDYISHVSKFPLEFPIAGGIAVGVLVVSFRCQSLYKLTTYVASVQ